MNEVCCTGKKMWLITQPDDQRDEENSVTMSLSGSLVPVQDFIRENPGCVSLTKI